LDDGSFHEVDSSEKAFYTAAQGCFREYFKQAGPKLLEPIMKVEIEVPEEFQGTVVGDVIKRRGIMNSNDIVDGNSIIIAEVPLAETFGYATDLRSMTQGQGTFTMELAMFRQVPANIQEEIVEKKKQEKLVGAK
jgi:elongation factor G